MATETPGPGHYNTTYKKSQPAGEPVPVLCFVRGGDNCVFCGKLLLGDYYKGDGTWCHPCYRKLKNPEGIKVKKVRHCSFFHKHIGLNNITFHKTTLKRVKALERKEKLMRIKFGVMVDHLNRPI